ncbi:hypothetical protein [Streptomyces sp. NRRL WC-3742]|uniref:hypothetical protein n=1 Tax=Streptomyces sp. NRRL WC-3742 TaxID=1463934 RepID=UPI000691E609|nr:hypothetical protein [Streptomyces sp. NRRL WC-3742]
MAWDELSAEEKAEAKAHASKERRDWLFHTVAFVVVQAVLWAVGRSWLVHWATGRPIDPEQRGVWMWIGRVWLTIWIIDTIWSWSYTFFPRRKKKAKAGSEV